MMETEATPLTTEDYAALHAMLLSPDASVRAQGAGLAKKLTPDEQQAFFDVQKTANAGKGERTREDSSLLGMPPELAIASGIPIARAVAGAGASLGAKATAAAGAAAPQLAAQAKYWGTKLTLMKLGVPSVLAEGVAIAASGIKKGGAKGEPPIAAEPTPSAPSAPAAPVAPVASAPAAPAPVVAAPVPVAPPVPPTAPPSPESGPVAPSPAAPSPAAAALPDQRALNEAALAVRRQAYQERLKAQTSAQVAETAPAAAPAAAGTVKLSAAETKAFLDLMKRGMSGPDAMKNVLLQRSLVDTLGTPTPTAAQTRFPKGQRGKVTS
jgi:hypothetical protein